MTEQKVFTVSKDYIELNNHIIKSKTKKVFLVCGKSIDALEIGHYFETLEGRLGVKVIHFSSFKPNPL